MTLTPKRSAGFSLIEVMCAILIMGVALTGLTHGVTAALRASKENELQTAAVAIAAGRMEMIRADGFILAGEEQSADDETGEALYRWKQTIEETSIDGLFEVTVTIEHARTKKKIYELKTLLFDAPLDTLSDEDDEDANRNGHGKGRRQ